MPPNRRLPPDFARSAAYPLYACDPVQDLGWVMHFEREDYRRASFLDQRALQHRRIGGWEVGRKELASVLDEAGAVPTPPVHWIFHIGHCGSSLLSRLLDLAPGVLGIREPLPLLTLATRLPAPTPAGDDDDWLRLARRALARGYADTRAVVVKPTSVVTALASSLLAGGGNAILLWTDLETWLATMLRDPGLREVVRRNEPIHLHFLQGGRQTPSGLEVDTDGSDPERMARVWLGEQLRWRRLAAGPEAAGRLRDYAFDAVLCDVATATNAIAAHFGLETSGEWAAVIEASGLMHRYAKQPGRRFDPVMRRVELDAASTRYRDEIDRGLRYAERWLEQAPMADAAVLSPRLRS